MVFIVRLSLRQSTNGIRNSKVDRRLAYRKEIMGGGKKEREIKETGSKYSIKR